MAASALLALSAGAALADVTEQEAIQAQVAGAMASADYAAAKCPKLGVDKERLAEQIKKSGKTAEQLRATEDYADQRNVVETMAKGEKGFMVCMLLARAHGGYGRGIVVEKE
ncbi:hypothetical protein F2P44_20910 [Massilia sp. CCM 8695]|uniref:DUF2501 domain-containing protein n=1 Tax=Massilia frigida TaxID=2609281 RepID=A0ABX0NJH9_9BURK|nr:hypothetical protein [Massilia frigida]NHZ81715.1 hypothetical protein [Massilia frigida]